MSEKFLSKQEQWLRSLPYYDKMVELNDEYDDEVDYVGPENSWKCKLIPRTIMLIDINVCAYIHDFWYDLGGDENDRIKADAVFLADMLRWIEETKMFWAIGWYIRKLARKRALMYYSAVRTLGKDNFNFHDS